MPPTYGTLASPFLIDKNGSYLTNLPKVHSVGPNLPLRPEEWKRLATGAHFM